MKNKKNIFLIPLLLLLGFSVMAQENEGVSFGLRGGINFQNINGKDPDGKTLKNDLVLRFNAGVVANIPVAPEFYFQPGLLYTTKGAKTTKNLWIVNSVTNINISYLELPLSFLYKPLLGTGHLLLGFGPYIAYGLDGKATYDVAGITGERDFRFENKYSNLLGLRPSFKRFDYGANLFFGYELQNGFSVQLNTQLGLAKINAENTLTPNADTSFKNTGFGISVGYTF